MELGFAGAGESDVAVDVELDGVGVFGFEAEEAYGYAVAAFFADDAGANVQRGAHVRDLEIEKDFFIQPDLEGGAQKHAAFADVETAQDELVVLPAAVDVGDERHARGVAATFPAGRGHGGEHGTKAVGADRLGEHQINPLPPSPSQSGGI